MYGGGYLWVDALAPVSAWEGIPIRVDAYTPGGLEHANHCRQPKTFKTVGKNEPDVCMARVRVPMGPTPQYLPLSTPCNAVSGDLPVV